MVENRIKSSKKSIKHPDLALNAIKHGKDSVVINSLQERLKLLPLDDVKKMEFETMLDQMQSIGWAFDFDKVIKSYLIDSMRDTDHRLMSYMADLQNTQMRIAKVSKDMAFHTKVLEDLKKRYLDAPDGEKSAIYADIQESEKTIAVFEKRVQDYIDLRNKIRKEIDKGKYQSKALKLKEDSMAGGSAKPVDIDFEVL